MSGIRLGWPIESQLVRPGRTPSNPYGMVNESKAVLTYLVTPSQEFDVILLPFLASAIGATPTVALSPSPETPLPVSAELTFKPYKEWDILLPDEQFAGVAEGIRLPHAGGEALAVKLEGTVLWVDRDGDGECEAKVEPLERGQTALMVVRVPAGENSKSYAVRLSSDGKWTYSASGAMVGEIEGTRIQLIDQNNNGRFDDFGEDAMIVGRGKSASFLSKVVNVNGELFSIGVDGEGTRIDFTPFEGEVGKLDLGSELDSKAKMRSVVVTSEDRSLSFEVSRSKGGMNVPAGTYRVHSGSIVLGKSKAELRTGRSQSIEVAANATAKLAWGGPVEAEFDFARSGDAITIGPLDIWYYGRSGEEYSNFMPLGSSPNFAIKDKKTGEVLVNAKFPGNC